MSTEFICMNIIERFGCVRGRKRLQKIVFLLKSKGLPIEQRFFMHFYGPYSSELSMLLDNLVNNGLLLESSIHNGNLAQYNYSLTPKGKSYLKEQNKLFLTNPALSLDDYSNFIDELNKRSVSELEIASTIIYWKNGGYKLSEAIDITVKQKKPKDQIYSEAMKLVHLFD